MVPIGNKEQYTETIKCVLGLEVLILLFCNRKQMFYKTSKMNFFKLNYLFYNRKKEIFGETSKNVIFQVSQTTSSKLASGKNCRMFFLNLSKVSINGTARFLCCL